MNSVHEPIESKSEVQKPNRASPLPRPNGMHSLVYLVSAHVRTFCERDHDDDDPWKMSDHFVIPVRTEWMPQ